MKPVCIRHCRRFIVSLSSVRIWRYWLLSSLKERDEPPPEVYGVACGLIMFFIFESSMVSPEKALSKLSMDYDELCPFTRSGLTCV